MNYDGYRINGGIGFSIKEPSIYVEIEENNSLTIIDSRKISLTDKEIHEILYILRKIIEEYGLTIKAKFTITGNSLPHYGLGSNTAIYLSCIEGLLLLNKREYQHTDIINLSKRGGTSGIGINTYFKGGFVMDVGIKREQEILMPSSVSNSRKKPLVIHHCKVPNWKIGICLPLGISNKSEEEEILFFQKSCPIDKNSVSNILYEALFGVTSSIVEHDYEIFSKSINTIQNTEWKKMERNIYEELFSLEDDIKKMGADYVGMSSLGPGLFFSGNNIDKIIKYLSSKHPDVLFYSTFLNNSGRKIIYA